MFVYWNTQWTPLIWDGVSVFFPKVILTDEHLAITAKVNSTDFLQIYSRQTQLEIAELSLILNRFEDGQTCNFYTCSQYPHARLPQQLFSYPPTKLG